MKIQDGGLAYITADATVTVLAFYDEPAGVWREVAGGLSVVSPKTIRPAIVVDARRLGWDRIPTAAEWMAWAESLPAGEFATGALAIADALRLLEHEPEPEPEPELDEPETSGTQSRDEIIRRGTEIIRALRAFERVTGRKVLL